MHPVLSVLGAVALSTAGRGLMNEIKMALPFVPTAKGRPKFRVIRGHVHAFTPAKTKDFEYRLKEYYQGAAGGYIFAKGVPISVSIEFGMAIPQSTSKKRTEQMINGYIKHTVKPDLDNMVKSVLDALNGVAWYDDAQIVQLNVNKRYTKTPNIYINIHDAD